MAYSAPPVLGSHPVLLVSTAGLPIAGAAGSDAVRVPTAEVAPLPVSAAVRLPLAGVAVPAVAVTPLPVITTLRPGTTMPDALVPDNPDNAREIAGVIVPLLAVALLPVTANESAAVGVP